jgi:hypothetical protein
MVTVARVKNHDFTPKNHIFPILEGAREIFGVFHVKNHDFTPKKSYFCVLLSKAYITNNVRNTSPIKTEGI